MTSNFYLFPFTKLMHQLRGRGAACSQSPPNKVLRWALFMKQNLRFGLVWARVGFRVTEFIAVLKTILSSIQLRLIKMQKSYSKYKGLLNKL